MKLRQSFKPGAMKVCLMHLFLVGDREHSDVCHKVYDNTYSPYEKNSKGKIRYKALCFYLKIRNRFILKNKRKCEIKK